MKESKPETQAKQSPEENDALWQLLGEAPAPKPDAWFTVRTLARCRYESQPAVGWWASMGVIWHRILGVALGLGLAVALMLIQIHSDAAKPAQASNVQDAFEIMATIDATDPDAASASPTWQESSK